jgi:cellobiose-specific phosphotransferase system component IIA
MTQEIENCNRAIRKLEFEVLDLQQEIQEAREKLLEAHLFRLCLQKKITSEEIQSIAALCSGDKRASLQHVMVDMMNALKESYEKTEKEDYMIMLDLIEDLGDE